MLFLMYIIDFKNTYRHKLIRFHQCQLTSAWFVSHVANMGGLIGCSGKLGHRGFFDAVGPQQ